ncbi:MAG: 16S rRNA (cytosine(1402)-N(4))-methyltransferase RsmH [Bacteroidaceae bacterium]|nr:16S rRNA (cytosine(1402)-N(4))-methyltransferase RsmH [Bacteroidaceae bacterium]
MDCPTYHIPVMLDECMEGLNIKPDGIYLDLTYGGGGHSKEILKRLGEKGHLYGFDQDNDARDGAMVDERFTFVHSNFRFVGNWMQYYNIDGVDGILADLGVSSHHLDDGERGFSFRYDAALDMRMNRKSSLTAHNIVMEYPEERLADILYLYGELKQSRRISAEIVRRRGKGDIRTTGQLSDIVSPLLGREREKKDLARVFQALRIEVNGEMKALGEMLEAATSILNKRGRLVIITYHSLEDRIVKNYIRGAGQDKDNCSVESLIYGNQASILKDIGKGAIIPSEDEININPRSRSAKLRIAEKR